MNRTYKYFAFISYSSKDYRWAKRLFRKLERYRMPPTLCKEKGWNKRPINPIFFAPYEIQPGDLSEEIKKRLEASQYLIVVGSPNSAKSDWVGKEIQYFYSLNRPNNIYYFIINGIPNSKNIKTECYHPILEELSLPEILGTNVNERFSQIAWVNKERAFVQLITKLLNIEFDSIWNRHKRLLIKKISHRCIIFLTIIIALIFTRCISLPTNINISLNDASIKNNNLPPLSNAKVTLHLNNELPYVIFISNTSEKGCFRHIPRNFIGQQVRLQISCLSFNDIDTIITLSNNLCIDMLRDNNYYGLIRLELLDSLAQPIGNCRITIDNFSVITGNDGKINFSIPLEKQKTVYKISAEIPLADDSIIMPCQNNNTYVILSK